MYANKPLCIRKDTLDFFQFRIRNLINFTLDDFQLDIKDNKIIVKTKNKKYFKKLEISDLKNYDLNVCLLKFKFIGNTLIVSVI